MFGCLLAGFYLLRVYDMGVATYTAAAINVAIAGLAFVLAGSLQHEPTAGAKERNPIPFTPKRAPGALLIYLAIALSGMSALGAEVVWTRLLSLLLGATVYTFSIILGVFLLGLWAGSSVGSLLIRSAQSVLRQPRLALAVSQILLAVAIGGTAFTLAHVLPYWPVDPWLSISPWFNFDLDFTRCLRAIFPATLLWGASFPLALASVAAEGEDPGRLSGEVYAANTAGSIVGALAFSLLLIPAIGTRGSQRVLIWLAAASAAIALVAAALGMRNRVRVRAVTAVGAVAATVLIALGLAATVSDVPWQVNRIRAAHRAHPQWPGRRHRCTNDSRSSLGEGINSSVVITQRGDQRFFYVSGKSEASSAPLDMRLQRMMGHMPALIHRAPRSVLVVGFGAGVTAGSFVPYPDVRSIVICELEASDPACLRRILRQRELPCPARPPHPHR